MEKTDNINENSSQLKAENELPHAQKVKTLLEIGDGAKDIYAWHGTAVEAILHLAKQGRLPTDGMHGCEFYYSPVKLATEHEQREEAEIYAQLLSTDHYLMTHLPFEVKDRSNFLWITRDQEAKTKFLKEEALPHGITEKQLDDLINQARVLCRGVLISISETIADDYEEEPGDLGENDAKIKTEKGLPIEYLSGITALGHYENQRLKQLIR